MYSSKHEASHQEEKGGQGKGDRFIFAEWERTTVYLHINAKVLDDDIKQVVVIGVERKDPPKD
jgi:hypothetical protein